MFVTSYTGNGVKKNYYNQISEYRYKKNYYTVGEFSLTISASDPGEPYRIEPGDLLYVDDLETVNDSLYVTTTECVRGRYVISGFDLKILLNWRITLFPAKEIEAGTYGYDVRQGYTGSIIKGYIDYNLCEASDPNRKIPGCWCAVDSGIGIENDTYMSRLQPLNEVVEALCANAGLGYDVFFDGLSGNIGINVYEGKDRRFGGIAFGAYIGNSDGIRLIRDNTAERSVVWAVNGIGVKDCTVTAVVLDDFSSAGIRRKEAVVTTNCSAADVSIYAKKAAEDYTATEEIDASADGSGYGNLFDVGDVVRVFDDSGGMSEMRIISAEKQYDGHSRRIKLSFADYFQPKSRKKVVNKLSAASTENKKDIIDQKIDTVSGGGEEENGLTIHQAVIIKEEDAKYILHDFTEIEYISGNKIGYAGAGNQVIVQSYFAYTDAFFRETATGSTTQQYTYPLGWEKPFSTYMELSGSFFQATTEYTKFYLELQEMQPTFARYFFKGVKSDGTAVIMQSFNIDNYNNWSGFGLALRWSNIFPPGYKPLNQNQTYEYGGLAGVVLCAYQQTANITVRVFNNQFFFPFASLAEYQAAVGLTYEPLTLTRVEDEPTVVSGKDVGEGVT